MRTALRELLRDPAVTHACGRPKQKMHAVSLPAWLLPGRRRNLCDPLQALSAAALLSGQTSGASAEHARPMPLSGGGWQELETLGPRVGTHEQLVIHVLRNRYRSRQKSEFICQACVRTRTQPTLKATLKG